MPDVSQCNGPHYVLVCVLHMVWFGVGLGRVYGSLEVGWMESGMVGYGNIGYGVLSGMVRYGRVMSARGVVGLVMGCFLVGCGIVE